MKIISIYTNQKLLIKKAKTGNREAQKWLYDKHAPRMLSVCRQYIKDVHFAEDVMIKGFLKVFLHLHTFKSEGSFEGWIRRIMVRECITELRKQRRIVFDDTIFETCEMSQVSMDSELDVAYIQVLIDDLPEGYKTVFVLYAIEGYKHTEIAQMLEISVNTSKSQLFKARRMLQEKLRQQEASEQA